MSPKKPWKDKKELLPWKHQMLFFPERNQIKKILLPRICWSKHLCHRKNACSKKKKLPPRCRRKGAYAFEKKIRRTKLEQKPSVSACRLLFIKKILPFFATQICIWKRRPLLCPTRVPPYLRSVLLLLAYMNIQLHMYVLRLYTVYVRCHCYMCAPQQEKGRQRKPLMKR